MVSTRRIPGASLVVAAMLLGGVAGCGESGVREPAGSKGSAEKSAAATKDGAGGSQASSGGDEGAKTAKAPAAAPESEATKAARATFAKLVAAQREENPDAWIAADAELVRFGKDAVPVLSKGLGSDDKMTRELASMVLVKLGPDAASAEPELVTALNDSIPLVQANAAASLSLLGVRNEVVVPALQKMLETGTPAIRTMAAYSLGNIEKPGEAVVKQLIALLDEESVDLQTAAAVSLGNLGQGAKEALPALEKLKTSETEGVRNAAVAAVERIRTGNEPKPATKSGSSESVAKTPREAVPPDAPTSGDEAAEAEIPMTGESEPVGTPPRVISRESSTATEGNPAGPRLSGPRLGGPN